MSRGADFVDGSLGVEFSLALLPRETNDDAVFVIIHIHFIVRDVQANQTVLNNGFCGIHLLVGGIKAIRRHKGDIHAALDINAETNVLCTLDVGGNSIAVLPLKAEESAVCKRQDQQSYSHKLPCLCSFFHEIGTSNIFRSNKGCTP